MKGEVRQNIYEHGGSKIWLERDGLRELVADTFLDEEFAKAVFEFVKEYATKSKPGKDGV